MRMMLPAAEGLRDPTSTIRLRAPPTPLPVMKNRNFHWPLAVLLLMIALGADAGDLQPHGDRRPGLRRARRPSGLYRFPHQPLPGRRACEDLDYFDKQWEINARGTFLGMKLARDLLAKSGRGSIVNMSSVLGLIAHEITHMGYNASKGAVRLMSKAAAVQFADQGIRVNSVHPGWMSAMRTSVSSADPEQRKKLNAEVPLKRSGTAEEAAQAVLFLASDDSSYVTGSELVVDGGLSAR